jgi:hypothetical protein
MTSCQYPGAIRQRNTNTEEITGGLENYVMPRLILCTLHFASFKVIKPRKTRSAENAAGMREVNMV